MIWMRLPALALLLLSVLLTGCHFDNPLSGPSKDVNTWLLGVWEYKDLKAKKTYRAQVTPITGDRYAVVLRELGKTPKETRKEWMFEGWIARVGGARLLNLHCKQSAGEIPVGSYVFLHYQVVDQLDVIMRPLQLDSAPDATSFQLRQEVRSKLKQGTLLPQIGTEWLRVSEVYWNKEDPYEQQPYQPLRFQEKVDRKH